MTARLEDRNDGNPSAIDAAQPHDFTTAVNSDVDDDEIFNDSGLTDEEKVEEPVTSPPLPWLEILAQKNPSPWDHLSITIGPPIIILFDIVVPCIIYYVWYN